MAIKYSDVINLLRTDYKGVIKASDPDFAGFCTNAKSSQSVLYPNKQITSVELKYVNKINFNSNNINWQLLYPFQGVIHFGISYMNDSNSYFAVGFKTMNYFYQLENIPKAYSAFMSYFYMDNLTSFNEWGVANKGSNPEEIDEEVVNVKVHKIHMKKYKKTYSDFLEKEQTYNNGNVKFINLRTSPKFGTKAAFFVAKPSSQMDTSWSTGIGFVFKDIHNDINFAKQFIGVGSNSFYCWNLWCFPVIPKSSGYSFNIDAITNPENFSIHDMRDYEEISLSNNSVDLK